MTNYLLNEEKMNNIGICEPNSSLQDEKIGIFSSTGTLIENFLVFSVHPTPSGCLNYIDNSFKYYLQEEVNTTIDTLINFQYKLNTPIKVKIVKNSQGIIGEIEDLELYSFGDNEFEVLRELNEDVTYLFEDLVNMKDENLGKFPKKWKYLLKQYITKIK